jgi:hypothetical protein
MFFRPFASSVPNTCASFSVQVLPWHFLQDVRVIGVLPRTKKHNSPLSSHPTYALAYGHGYCPHSLQYDQAIPQCARRISDPVCFLINFILADLSPPRRAHTARKHPRYTLRITLPQVASPSCKPSPAVSQFLTPWMNRPTLPPANVSCIVVRGITHV